MKKVQRIFIYGSLYLLVQHVIWQSSLEYIMSHFNPGVIFLSILVPLILLFVAGGFYTYRAVRKLTASAFMGILLALVDTILGTLIFLIFYWRQTEVISNGISNSLEIQLLVVCSGIVYSFLGGLLAKRVDKQ